MSAARGASPKLMTPPRLGLVTIKLIAAAQD
jgi:hypothetical protein